jgi:lactose/cellobiose-specific phosphotransferase system IIC component
MKETKSSPIITRALNILETLGSISILLVLQRSLSIVLPIIMVGAFGLMIRHFPFPVLTFFLDEKFGQEWQVLFDNIISGTLGIVSLALLCTFSGVMTMVFNQKRKGPFISPVMAIVVVLSSFFVITAPESNASWEIIFSMDQGLLPAIIIAMTGCTLFLQLSQYRFLQWPLGAVGHDPVVRDVLTVLPAGAVTILFFCLLRIIFFVFGITDIHDDIRNLLFHPFAGVDDSIGFGLAYTGLSQFFWFFGAHGPNLLFPVEEHILSPAVLTNGTAIAHGLLPKFIFTKAFFDVFTRIGGSGCTLCLIFAIILKSRDLGARKLCFFALFPALCNVNEPILFGIPLVLNPVYMVPFILIPLVQTLTAYLATFIGWIPHTTEAVTWTTPVLVSGFVSTGSVAGSVMQAVNLAIGTMIYIPFVRLADRLREKQGERMLKMLMIAACCSEISNRGTKLIDLSGESGRFAKYLARDLESALNKEGQLYLEYQPQISGSDLLVHGVEALLRWRHPVYGLISPPITVALAEDLGIIDRLGKFVLTQACIQRAAWKGIVDEFFCMSVNVAPMQLTNPVFTKSVTNALEENGLDARMLELEITESTVVDTDKNTMVALQNLQKHGVRIAIDDFGMGHASLRYLRSFPVTTVKIDRSLTIGNAGEVNDHIVRSVVELSRTLGFDTVIEGVETQEQLTRFSDMGCKQFQGYFFSKSLSGKECMIYILNRINMKN